MYFICIFDGLWQNNYTFDLEEFKMKICVIGTGYVGLVTGTCLADLGNRVVCIDNNPEKLACLKRHEVPFYEPGLAERIKRNVEGDRLVFSDSIEDNIQEAEIIFIGVGTPPLPTGEADLSAVYAVANSVFDAYQRLKCSDFKVLVTKSTVPVGTGQTICEMRDASQLSDHHIGVVSNPEFLREGTAIYDFFHPDRIVIGSENEVALDRITELYEPLYRNETPIVRTDMQTSELSKYASNAFLATKISFINEMSNLCELHQADVNDISKIMGMDGRIGRYFLHPGPGYGGSCFPKDTQALIHMSERVGYDLKIVKAVEAVNVLQKQHVISHIKEYFGSSLEGKTFAILGLSFKPNTDDVRDASSIVIIQGLLDMGASINAFDPEVKQLDAFKGNDAVKFAKNSYDAATDADAVILVTEWNTFRELDLAELKKVMKTSVFFDLRNVYAPEKLVAMGFEVYTIGRHPLRALLRNT